MNAWSQFSWSLNSIHWTWLPWEKFSASTCIDVMLERVKLDWPIIGSVPWLAAVLSRTGTPSSLFSYFSFSCNCLSFYIFVFVSWWWNLYAVTKHLLKNFRWYIWKIWNNFIISNVSYKHQQMKAYTNFHANLANDTPDLHHLHLLLIIDYARSNIIALYLSFDFFWQHVF